MKQLIGFEVRKMLRKPLVWAALIGLFGFMAIMEYSWVVPGYASVQMEEDGRRIVIEGFDAIALDQESCALYHGSLTDEKVRSIIETYDISDAAWEAGNIDPDREMHYTHNLLYNILAVCGFINFDGSYKNVTVEDIFGDLAPGLVIGYSTGWECTINVLMFSFLLWGCVLVVIVAPVFSEEYTIHMDALILTGIHGRRKCTLAKIISAFLISVAGSTLLLTVGTLLMLAVHGSVGWDCSVQLGELAYFNRVPYQLNWLQLYGLSCLAWFGGMLVLTSIVLVVSALAKSSFSAVVIAFVIYAVPMFLPWNALPESLEVWGYLLPINQMQLRNLFGFDLFTLGNLAFPPIYLAIPITVIVSVAGILWSKKGFSQHQVV
ncbi:MAG: ABC transporter permease subunit [Lachnospiraceae bacterium]|nr:ABC transporter permease subunit [Lachnospiraceae bacterium]MCM1238558.1 ABC transporter permease subunit [Lachnospiraceae bacterium]